MANVTDADIDCFKAIFGIAEAFMDPEGDDAETLQHLAQHRTQATAELVAALKQASWLLADLSPDGLVKKAIDDVLSKYEER